MSQQKRKNRSLTRRFMGHEMLELRSMLSGSPWQNPMACDDLNGDGSVSPSDALVAINAINSGVSGQLSGKLTAPTATGSTSNYLDANGDGQLSPADPLMVINSLNSGSTSTTTGDDSGDDDGPTTDQPGTIGADDPTLTLTNGFARVRADIGTDGDVDVFQVTASAAMMNVALFTKASGDLTVSLEDASGTVIATASTADAAAHQPAALTTAVTAGTTYYVVVSGGSGVTGNYCLQVINNDTGEIPPPPAPGGGDTSGSSGSDDGSGDTTGGSDDDQQPPPTPAQIFAKLDMNTDGSLSLTEFEALPAPKDSDVTPTDVFTKLDTDSSGGLSLDEFAVLFAHPPGGPGQGGPGGGPGGGGGPVGGSQGGQQGKPPTAEALFTKLDTDTSGSLTETEFAPFVPASSPTPADQIFATWDTDSSGLMSLSEFKAGLLTLKKH